MTDVVANGPAATSARPQAEAEQARGGGSAPNQAREELEPQSFRVTRADLIRYAGASGDFNPIHYSDRVATEVGLPGVIAHGMFTMALAGRAISAWMGRPDAVVDFGVRFTRPVVVPDDDEGTWVRVTGVRRPDPDGGLTRLDLTVTCNGEKVLAQARATVRFD